MNMKFATIDNLENDNLLIKNIPKKWIKKKLIVSPKIDFNGAEGYFIAIKIPAKKMIELPKEKVRNRILEAAIYAQEKLNVNLIQLGALTTSVSSGGLWLAKKEEYNGYINHGDSYTAAVTCQAVRKVLDLIKKKPTEMNLAILGAYGIIGEAVSKILVPSFNHSILIGPRIEKLKELSINLDGKFEISRDLKTLDADIIVTATNHPEALLKSHHLKKNAIVIDISQPVNLSHDICKERPDIIRIDGGYVDVISKNIIPTLPKGKLFSCIAEVIMQTMEDDHRNYVGSIDLKHLKRTEKWAEKYGYTLNELTNFGKSIYLGRLRNESNS